MVTAVAGALRRLGERAGGALTIGLVALVVGGVGFGAVAIQVRHGYGLARLDFPVTAGLAAHRVAWLTATMAVVTWLGSFAVTLPAVLLTALVLPVPGRRGATVSAALFAVLGVGLLTNYAKILAARARPSIMDMLVGASGYAFPSGHTTQATAAWGFVAFVVSARVGRRARWRAAVWGGAVAIAVAVGFSRVYLGVHWLTDVIGGLALGTAWLALVVTVFVSLGAAQRSRPDPPP